MDLCYKPSRPVPSDSVTHFLTSGFLKLHDLSQNTTNQGPIVHTQEPMGSISHSNTTHVDTKDTGKLLEVMDMFITLLEAMIT